MDIRLGSGGVPIPSPGVGAALRGRSSRRINGDGELQLWVEMMGRRDGVHGPSKVGEAPRVMVGAGLELPEKKPRAE